MARGTADPPPGGPRVQGVVGPYDHAAPRRALRRIRAGRGWPFATTARGGPAPSPPGRLLQFRRMLKRLAAGVLALGILILGLALALLLPPAHHLFSCP